ncbi:hypothetical protein C8Q77DRAFT_113738 [Trametes polyzona]|nr:hypothetical protein C8Q77DRAFT_113738 [Trametes polyzona]
MSLLKAWRSVSSMNGPPDAPKKSRFSLLSRPSVRHPRAALDIELPDGTGAFWTPPTRDDRLGATVGVSLGATGGGTGGGGTQRDGEVSLERSFTLSILEGAKHPGLHARTPRESTGTTNTYVSASELAPAPEPAPEPAPSPKPSVAASVATAAGTPPPVPPKSRARSTSVSSSRSVSGEGRRRKPSLKPQALGLPELEEPRPDESGRTKEHELERGLPPGYSSLAYPTHEVTYRFAQAGPFSLTLQSEGKDEESRLWRYHIGVGLNVWTLRSWVTTVRRGGEDGLVVAEIESGASAGSTTVTMGDASRPSREILSRTLGSKMYFIGDGTAIRWNLGESRWVAFFDSVELATFDLSPPRRLVMQPLAHRFFDHIVVAVLLLMRERDDAACQASTTPPSPIG